MNYQKLGWSIFGLVFLFDRLFKVAAWRGFSLFGWEPNLVINQKAISGLFLSSFSAGLLSAAIIIFLIYCLVKNQNHRLWLAWVIGGAASNLYDRIVYTGVIDVFKFNWWPWVFNIADIMIFVGLLIYIFKYQLAKR